RRDVAVLVPIGEGQRGDARGEDHRAGVHHALLTPQVAAGQRVGHLLAAAGYRRAQDGIAYEGRGLHRRARVHAGRRVPVVLERQRGRALVRDGIEAVARRGGVQGIVRGARARGAIRLGRRRHDARQPPPPRGGAARGAGGGAAGASRERGGGRKRGGGPPCRSVVRTP